MRHSPAPAFASLAVTLTTKRGLTSFAGPADVVEIGGDGETEGAAVEGAFARLDAALREGYTIAGYATYELGALLCGVPFVAADGPLLAIGIYDGAQLAPAPRAASYPALAPSVALIARQTYDAEIAEIARLLRDGDLYQANLTVPFAAPFEGDPDAIFAALAERAAAPYAALVRHGTHAFVSLSPELFLAFEDDTLVARPMKGTTGPYATDGLQAQKNRAEHVMIVDLVRNDLSRVCSDVGVERLFAVERYPTFATMTSTVRGRLRAGAGLFDIFAATFPCGSITGAPKLAAMHAIARLEARPRGIAMGTIGYLEPQRRGWWNVAIRTMAVDAATQRADLRIGGGIVADSNAADEWAEVLLKRRVFDDAASRVGLLETLRVHNGTADVDVHLARLLASAEAFGIDVDGGTLRRTALEFVAAVGPGEPVLLRFTLERDGSLHAVERRLEAFAPDALVCATPTRVRSTDPLLRHKTTRRGAYDAALAFATARGCVEGLLFNERDELADGSRSTPFVRYGDTWLTPPLEAGALAGILRARMLSSGAAIEATLRRADLAAAAELAIGNAARGLVRVRPFDARS